MPSSYSHPRREKPPSTSSISIIAHDREVQHSMDAKRISWGVQYELARGVSGGRWQWSDVTEERLNRLKGPESEAAHLVEQVMHDANVSRSVRAASIPLWAELEREQAAIEEGAGRGLGLRGEWKGDPNWYGGKIRQIASVVEAGDGFALRLKPMMKRKSNRFARYLGSRRMLQVKLPDDKLIRKRGDDVKRFMQSRFVLCGRVFVAFAAKDGKVFLMETNEDYERVADGADRTRMTLEDLVQWHNPMDLNSKQPVTKWVTRFDLGLSDTVPALAFEGEGIDIFYIDDKTAPHVGEKVPAEKILTDGCGFMNWAALAAIARAFRYTRFPTAVQGRFAGTKGVWTLHPEDRSPDVPPKIWIRPSQRKIQHGRLEPSHRIFELVAPPRVSIPSRLSRHTVMVLSHNGVPDNILINLMAAGIESEVQALSSFDDLHLLRATVAEVGRIFPARLQRLASGSARLFGLGREWGQEADEDDDVDDLEQIGSVSLVDRNEYSGDPIKVHERACEMIAAGFRPQENPILFKCLRDIVSYRIAELIKEYHITVPKSADAFIIPDPYGVLEPGQIHFKSSENLKDPLDGSGANMITGNVLIYRNPARLPADIQKVSAVIHPQLSDYTDVIIFPTKGPRSMASLLAGGDYDGDTCVCIFDELLVQSFGGSPITDAPTDFLKNNFESQDNILQIADVLSEMRIGSISTRVSPLQEALLVGMISPNVGQYSIFHENTGYLYGLADKRSLHNAWMFNTVLDSKKTGLTVKRSVLARDTKDYGHAQPHCMTPAVSEDVVESGSFGHGRPCPKRDPTLPTFILDEILSAGKTLEIRYLKEFEASQHQNQHCDHDLLKPWEDQLAWATRLREEKGYTDPEHELQRIPTHVSEHRRNWLSAVRAGDKSRTTLAPDGSKGSLPAVKPSERFREVAKSFADGPADIVFHDARTMSTLKASYAYTMHPKFAFSVAFYDLCRIKAESLGIAPQTREFADMMTVPSSARRILLQKASGL
ncbi:RNA dependent RNA polymerase-domain-containing protein [Fomitopsis serialis]|uniref:RNA dependent RNA polymerase-domain-containing protein n=1 Tax=Fomitopsis serialis TaxID=139415 RepID=UPI002008B6DC|nr:RNA dependent RNA polymerase-domain-containing protein [Neoantrodia serialis]KAH9923676.1 RNA dependent RNA polymerase-domain-containing protein [Neoantrodia serialis]